jgi:hypothetical protein
MFGKIIKISLQLLLSAAVGAGIAGGAHRLYVAYLANYGSASGPETSQNSIAPTPNPGIQKTPIPEPPLAIKRILAKSASSPNPRPCDLINGYQIGMSMDEFKAHYAEMSQEPPECHSNEYSGENCEGHISIGKVPVRAEFHFGNGKLFSIGARFGRYDFDSLKTELSDQFGYDGSEGLCRAMRDTSTMTPEDIKNINEYGGCESVMWLKHGISISLNQVPPLVNGERFSMLPLDLNTDKYSSCPMPPKTPDGPEEVARQKTINRSSAATVLCVNIFMEIARRKGYSDPKTISEGVIQSCSEHLLGAGFTEIEARDFIADLVQSRLYNASN